MTIIAPPANSDSAGGGQLTPFATWIPPQPGSYFLTVTAADGLNTATSLPVRYFATGTVSAFPTALEDRLHQSYRAHLAPGLADVLKLRAPGLLGCALSGAGPSIIVFYERGCEQVCDLVRQVLTLHGRSSEALVAPIAEHGDVDDLTCRTRMGRLCVGCRLRSLWCGTIRHLRVLHNDQQRKIALRNHVRTGPRDGTLRHGIGQLDLAPHRALG